MGGLPEGPAVGLGLEERGWVLEGERGLWSSRRWRSAQQIIPSMQARVRAAVRFRSAGSSAVREGSDKWQRSAWRSAGRERVLRYRD